MSGETQREKRAGPSAKFWVGRDIAHRQAAEPMAQEKFPVRLKYLPAKALIEPMQAAGFNRRNTAETSADGSLRRDHRVDGILHQRPATIGKINSRIR